MISSLAFLPTGPLLSFTAAVVVPASVQAISLSGEQAMQVCLTNADATNDAVIGWGATDAIAKANAAAPATTANSFFLLRNSQAFISVPSNSFFTGITGAATAAIKVQAGISH
jgi:hypothetical protein